MGMSSLHPAYWSPPLPFVSRATRWLQRRPGTRIWHPRQQKPRQDLLRGEYLTHNTHWWNCRVWDAVILFNQSSLVLSAFSNSCPGFNFFVKFLNLLPIERARILVQTYCFNLTRNLNVDHHRGSSTCVSLNKGLPSCIWFFIVSFLVKEDANCLLFNPCFYKNFN